MTRDSLSLGPVVSPAVQLLFGTSFSSATYSAPQYCTWVGGSQRRAYIISELASTSRPRALSNGRRRGTVWLSLDLVGRSVVSVARWSIEVSQSTCSNTAARRGEAKHGVQQRPPPVQPPRCDAAALHFPLPAAALPVPGRPGVYGRPQCSSDGLPVRPAADHGLRQLLCPTD